MLTKIDMRRAWSLASLLFVLGARAGAEPRSFEKSIDVEFRAGFLEPGLEGHHEKSGDEIEFGPVTWLASNEGSVTTRIWNVSAPIEFETDGDSATIKRLRYRPTSSSADSLWDVWRHRHAYLFLPGDGYYWNSLEDVKPRMDSAAGAFDDQYLKELWSYWTIKRWPQHAERPDIERRGTDDSDSAILKKSVRIEYDAAGLTRPVRLAFQINLWHMPVRIFLDVASSSATANGEVAPHLIGTYRWSYDRSEWRRRHGYHQGLWGKYKTDEGWPEKRKLSEQEGRWLDELLDRCVSYWVDVATEEVMADLESKVDAAVADVSSAAPEH